MWLRGLYKLTLNHAFPPKSASKDRIAKRFTLM